MEQKIARPVTVGGKTYMPGDNVPTEVLDKITNPKVFVPVGEPTPDEETAGTAGTSDGRKLVTTVQVNGRLYGPADHIPDDVAEKIRNPKAWADQPEPEEPEESDKEPATGDSDKEKAPAKKTAPAKKVAG